MFSRDGAYRDAVVAVDAMGGDFAPDEVIKGTVDAHRRGVPVILVGPSDVVRPHLAELGADVPLHEAETFIGMEEPVTQALRRKGSSLHVATALVADGEADAVVSCGNSAAIMAIAHTTLGTQSGIDRPAFGTMLPTRRGGVFVLDIGANTSVRASNLVQFAIMGDVYVHLSRDVPSPRIALLSNGSEDSKGTKEIKEANEALRKLDLNFIGNVEGNQVFEDIADVIVSDGFSGNVLLKGGEGVASEIFHLLKDELSKDFVSRIAAAALMPAFTRVRQLLDYEEYGGAPVLGVNGVMINCHGRSRAKAVTNAIFQADRMAHEHLVERIGEALHHEDAEVKRARRLARKLHLRHAEP